MTSDGIYILVLQIVAVISVCLSALVILTLLCFRSMRSKVMMQMIACIALSNLLSDIAYVSPYRPGTGSFGCGAQAVLLLTCYPMAWLWTTVVTYFLYSLAVKRKMPRDLKLCHAVCWGIPIVMTLSTLAVSGFGRNSEVESFEVCNFKSASLQANVFHFVTFYGLLCACFASIAYWKYQLYQLGQRKDNTFSMETFLIAQNALKMFPCALVVCWLPRLVVMACELVTSDGVGSNAITLATIILKISYGICCAGIFFLQSSEARMLWYKLCFAVPDRAISVRSSNASTISIGEAAARAVTAVENALHLSMDDDSSFG